MAAYDLATQGARASATMIFTMLNLINLVPAHWGLRSEQNDWFLVTFFQVHFLEINTLDLFQISMKFVLEGPIDNRSALVQVMTWHQTGAKVVV